jgi:hypothetical protein
MPNAPTRKHPIMVSTAFLGIMPPSMRYFFADGNILKSEEKIYTAVS